MLARKILKLWIENPKKKKKSNFNLLAAIGNYKTHSKKTRFYLFIYFKVHVLVAKMDPSIIPHFIVRLS